MENRFIITYADSPVIAAAIHDGHYMDPDFLAMVNLQEHERMREEDPYTAYLVRIPANQLVVGISRFQTDLNRTREKAVYERPEDAWGLPVWKLALPDLLKQKAMRFYDEFYVQMGQLLTRTIRTFGGFILLDIHSYNHRRESPDRAAPIHDNPEINVGTAHNHSKWQSLCREFIECLSATDIRGKHPDVRENIKFRGGGFSEWINRHYGDDGCVLSVEFKKTFMDEWTGRVDIDHLNELKAALKATLPVLSRHLTFIKP